MILIAVLDYFDVLERLYRALRDKPRPETHSLIPQASRNPGLLAKLEAAGVLAEWADASIFVPRHPAARRLCTIHADFHPGNMLQLEKGLLCIDV